MQEEKQQKIVILININMRCIEITIYDPYDLECSLININMRCIEIGLIRR